MLVVTLIISTIMLLCHQFVATYVYERVQKRLRGI
jgi:hypothetical protein